MLMHCETAALCSALAAAAAAAASRGDKLGTAARGAGAMRGVELCGRGISEPVAMLGPVTPILWVGSDKADFAAAGGQAGGAAAGVIGNAFAEMR